MRQAAPVLVLIGTCSAASIHRGAPHALLQVNESALMLFSDDPHAAAKHARAPMLEHDPTPVGVPRGPGRLGLPSKRAGPPSEVDLDHTCLRASEIHPLSCPAALTERMELSGPWYGSSRQTAEPTNEVRSRRPPARLRPDECLPPSHPQPRMSRCTAHPPEQATAAAILGILQ